MRSKLIFMALFLSFCSCNQISNSNNDVAPTLSKSFGFTYSSGYLTVPYIITESVTKDPILSYKIELNCSNNRITVLDRSVKITDAEYSNIINNYNSFACSGITETNFSAYCKDQVTDAGDTTLQCHFDDGSEKDLSFYDGCISPSETQTLAYQLSDELETIRKRYIPDYEWPTSCNDL